jgi:hypothetical protein
MKQRFGTVLGKARWGKTGVSLPEILIALGLFSTALAGLYLASVGMFEGLRNAMKLDVEAAYANMLIARINPNHPLVETEYDVTTKTLMSLPDDDGFYYTQIVDSQDATPDIKDINLYLYRAEGDANPYRQIRREITPYLIGLNLGEDEQYYKDQMGWVWQPVTQTFSPTAGSRRNGMSLTAQNVDGTTLCPAVENTPQPILYQKMQEPNNLLNALEYKFLATPGRNYRLKIGAMELDPDIAGGQRLMRIVINGRLVGLMDTRAEARASCLALMKTFTVSPVDDDADGIHTITVRLEQGEGATALPRASLVGMERTEL